jgi:acyl-[acyl-carrier-protein]-phospholipid O-acyltransferase/long-chain-fatty-acid--[acyl-carrier-protein] ligase
MILKTLLSTFLQVRAFAEPDWQNEKPHLYLLTNATVGELAVLQKRIQRTLRVIVHESAAASIGAGVLGGFNVQCVSGKNTQLARDLISDSINRGMPAVLIERGFSVEFLDEVMNKARVPTRVVVSGRDGLLDISQHHPVLSLQPFSSALRVYFSETIAPAEYSRERIQQWQLRLSARALDDHSALKGTLVRACLAGLKKRQTNVVMIDAGQGGKSLTGGMLIAIAWQISLELKKKRSRRIGIVLPPGIAATVANLACLMADKIPVNLNFTVGRASVESAMRTGEISDMISARQLKSKLKDFPWPEGKNLIDIGDELKSIDKIGVLQKRWTVFWSSASVLADRLGLPEKGNHEEAGLLFTSGSSGEPKGVPLSHRNILANTAQVSAVLRLSELPSLLGCLPVFHSFGFTVGLWWPLIRGPKVITYPSPLDFAKLIETIEKYEIALYVTTPTFLRSVMKKAKKEQLRSLRMAVTGAEKLPPAVKDEFEQRYGIPVCEGYGMTETTPVISVNLLENKSLFIPGRVTGSVGPLLPGVDVQVRSVTTGEPVGLNESGMLWFGGANVFRGYLNLPEKSEEVLQDGWYVSGDVGRLDPQGFLYIEGRVSRFSKIGGEMVPHGTVENQLMELLQEQLAKEVHVAVFGKSDEAKGESLVVLVDTEIDSSALRTLFQQKGLPNLWWPKKFIQVESLPALASGKLDLKACQEMVDQG